MGASLTGSDGSCRCPMPARQNTPLGNSLYACGHAPTRRDHQAIGQLTMKKNWSADSLLLKSATFCFRGRQRKFGDRHNSCDVSRVSTSKRYYLTELGNDELRIPKYALHLSLRTKYDVLRTT